MPTFELQLGSVSWINDESGPIWLAASTKLLSPEWVPKTYIGLKATSNSRPPDRIDSFRSYQNTKNFRALMFSHLQVEIDDKDNVTAVTVLDEFIDPGWTPPFKKGKYPSTAVPNPFDVDATYEVWYSSFQPGEASPVSEMKLLSTHPNSTIGGPYARIQASTVVDALIKFRAGYHTDDVGIKIAESPFHVPWVWCEFLLAYSGGVFFLYGRGAAFPSHAWYLNGEQMMTTRQVWDHSFPTSGIVFEDIHVHALKIFPVLSKGAPATGFQVSAASDSGREGKVDAHPYTAAGGQEASATRLTQNVPKGNRPAQFKRRIVLQRFREVERFRER